MKAYHDVHIHNYLSNCCEDMQATVDNYIKIEKDLGRKLMGFANHTWDESIPLPPVTGGWGKQMYTKGVMSWNMQIKPQIPKDIEGIKILVGAETEYSGNYDILGMGREAALQLDYVLIPHTHCHIPNGFIMEPWPTKCADEARGRLAEILSKVEGISAERAKKWADRLPVEELKYYMTGEEDNSGLPQYIADFMVTSFRGLMNNETLKTYSDDVPVSVAHPFQPVGFGAYRMEAQRLINDNTYGELFTMAAKRGIGLEINCSTNNEESFRLYGIAKECGCKFTLGTDAHSRGELAGLERTQPLLDRLAITEDDMMDFVRV